MPRQPERVRRQVLQQEEGVLQREERAVVWGPPETPVRREEQRTPPQVWAPRPARMLEVVEAVPRTDAG